MKIDGSGDDNKVRKLKTWSDESNKSCAIKRN